MPMRSAIIPTKGTLSPPVPQPNPIMIDDTVAALTGASWTCTADPGAGKRACDHVGGKMSAGANALHAHACGQQRTERERDPRPCRVRRARERAEIPHPDGRFGAWALHIIAASSATGVRAPSGGNCARHQKPTVTKEGALCHHL